MQIDLEPRVFAPNGLLSLCNELAPLGLQFFFRKRFRRKRVSGVNPPRRWLIIYYLGHPTILPEPLPFATIDRLANCLSHHYIRRMQIDLEPRHHSHQYELKPMNRWWLLGAAAFAAFGIIMNGIGNPVSWVLLGGGGMLAGFAILCFPRYWLGKIND